MRGTKVKALKEAGIPKRVYYAVKRFQGPAKNRGPAAPSVNTVAKFKGFRQKRPTYCREPIDLRPVYHAVAKAAKEQNDGLIIKFVRARKKIQQLAGQSRIALMSFIRSLSGSSSGR